MGTKFGAAVALGVGLTFAGTLRSNEQAEAQRILDDAIRAIGGEARLARFNAATWKSKGTLRFGNTTREFTSDWAIHGLNRYRKAKISTEQERESKAILVLNGDQAWFRRDDREPILFSGKQLTPARTENYTHWLALRLDISKTARLSLLGETQVDGRPALGVKVQTQDSPDVDLFFDKQTRLLTRMDTYITTSRGEAATETRVFRDYQEAEGIKYARKVEWIGKNGDDPAIQQEERYDFNVHENLDETLFKKP